MKKDNILAVSVLLLAIFLCSLFSFKEGVLSISLFSIFFSIIGISIVQVASKGFNKNYLMKVFLWGYSLRVLTAIGLYLFLVTFRGEPFLGGGDDYNYNIVGNRVGEFWAHYGLCSLEATSLRRTTLAWIANPGYFYVVAFFYYISHYLGGGHLLVPIFLNCLLGGLIPIFVYKVTLRVYGNQEMSKISALLAAFLPNMVLFSSVLLKDMIIVFLITLIIWYIIKFYLDGGVYSLIMLFLSAVPLIYFRKLVLFVLFISIGLFFLWTSFFSKKKKVTRVPVAIFTIIGIGLLFSLYPKQNLYEQSPSFVGFISPEIIKSRVFFNIQRAINLPESLGGESLTKIAYTSPWYLELLLRPLALLIVPFPPWRLLFDRPLPDSANIVYFPGTLVWYILMPLFVFGIIHSVRFIIREKSPPASFICGLTLILFFAIASYEITLRYRLMCMPSAIILIAMEISHHLRPKDLVPFYVTFYSLLTTTYIFLKYKNVFPIQFLFMVGSIFLITAYFMWKRPFLRR